MLGVISRLDPSLSVRGRGVFAWGDLLEVSDEDGYYRQLAAPPDGGYIQQPAWRSDGAGLAYTRVAPLPTPEANESYAYLRFTSAIWEIDATGHASAIAQPEAPGVMFSQPTWSPDGSAIYYTRETFFRQGAVEGATQAIEQRSIGTGQHQIVVADGLSPALSPDGKSLVFVRFASGGRADAWVHNLVDGTERRLTDGRFGYISSPRFAPDGRRIAFGAAAYPLVADAPSDRLATIPDRIVSWLAPTAEAHEVRAGLWIVGVDATQLRRVGTFSLDAPVVRWTADPNEILVYDENGLHRVDVTTGTLSRPLAPGGYRGFDWVPDQVAPR